MTTIPSFLLVKVEQIFYLLLVLTFSVDALVTNYPFLHSSVRQYLDVNEYLMIDSLSFQALIFFVYSMTLSLVSDSPNLIMRTNINQMTS